MTAPRRPRAALATSADWPDLAPDDRAIAPALARVGVDAAITIWSDPGVAWEHHDLIIVRSSGQTDSAADRLARAIAGAIDAG